MSDYLIDFHLAIEAMSRISDSICEAEAVDALCEVPTIELIRCKDCKYVGTDATLLRVCNREGMGLRPFHVYSDDYCSYAESKEEQ